MATTVATSFLSKDILPRRLVEKRAYRSRVWKYFAFEADQQGLIKDLNKPVCKRCHRTILAKGGNTSNLAKHLRDRHPDLFRDFQAKQSKSGTNEDSELHRPNVELELESRTTLFRTKILSLMESLMVKTTSEIVSIFDEIYMGAERELIQRRKEVELLTRRLKEREQSVAQNVYDNLPSLKLEPREEFLEGVLSHGIPERTETVEFALECVVLKAEEPVNSASVGQPSEYQMQLSHVTGAQQEPMDRADEELLGSPVWAAQGVNCSIPPAGQAHKSDQETTYSTDTAEFSSSLVPEDSASPRQDLVVHDAPEPYQTDLPTDQRCRQPDECMEFRSVNPSPDAHFSTPQESEGRADEKLQAAPAWVAQEDQSQCPPKRLPCQTDQEKMCSAITSEQSSSMAVEESAGASQDLVDSNSPKSSEVVPPVCRRRGRSAGQSSVSFLAPGTSLRLRSHSAAVNTSSRPQEPLEGFGSSLSVDSCGPNHAEEAASHCLSSESETENSSDFDIKSTVFKRKTAKSKTRGKTEDVYHRAQKKASKRSSAVESVTPKKKRTMIAPECKHDVYGALYPFEKILQQRITTGGKEEVRVKWWPCSTCGAKWRNSWEPA